MTRPRRPGCRTRLAHWTLFLAAIASFVAAPSPAADTALPPAEELRRFFDEGPAWLLPVAEKERLRGLPEGEALAAIRAFLAADPVPSTPGNELVEGIERRRRAIWADGLAFGDERARARFLLGPPRERVRIECGETYRPAEVWSWGPVEAPRSLVFFRPRPDSYFVAWRPTESKRLLYTEEMEYYLEQWDELRGLLSGKRPDRVMCNESKLIDRVTGVNGLFGFEKDRPTDAAIDRFFAPPVEVAGWATAAAAEVVRVPQIVPGAEAPPEAEPVPSPAAAAAAKRHGARPGAAETDAPAASPVPMTILEELPIEAIRIGFPERIDQRLQMRVRILLPAGLQPGIAEVEGGRESRFSVTGRVELAGAPFDEFRNRFVVVAPERPAPVVLISERAFRAGGPYVLTLEVRDEISGKTSFVSRGFTVPAEPIPEPDPSPEGAIEVAGQETGLTKRAARDALVLMPPLSDVVFGLWRAEAIVVGERIRRVAFYVNGTRQLERSTAPWSAELRLPNLPTELVVRAEGLDENGEVVAADEVFLNEPQAEPKVRLLAPERGKRVVGRAVARAAVVVPEGKRIESVEFRLNDEVLATLARPPWEVAFTAPSSSDPVYLTVAATYVDGTRVEDFRVLNGGQFSEQVDVDLVEIFATVFDRSGRIVENLEQGDFTLLDRGRPQTISRFELMRDLPLSVGIVLDTSGSMRETIGEAKRAAADFLSAVVRVKDRCFATSFADRPRLLMPLTSDARAVEAAFRDLPAVGNTALHDAILFSLYQLKGVRGRRAIVLLSDGDDTSSLVGYDDALEFARRSGTAIYTIGLDIGKTQMTVRGKLEKLSSETGGRSFFVSKASDLAGVYGEIERELRSQYLLAFAPTPQAKSGVFAPVEVRAGSGLKVRAPRGYYP